MLECAIANNEKKVVLLLILESTEWDYEFMLITSNVSNSITIFFISHGPQHFPLAQS